MRRALIISLVLLSLSYLERRRAKAWLRRIAVAFCRKALDGLSDPYALRLKKAVVFAPHQDDETFGCGGLIARKRNEGFPVDVIFITDGSASHPGHARFSPADIAALRRREAREALAILGVESGAIHFLDEPDGTLRELPSTRRTTLVARIAELLRELQPDEIFLPCSPDGSSEHDAAFTFVIDALRQSQLQPEVWQYPVWTWWNPSLLIRRVLRFRGHCRVPTEDYRLIKHRAVACYRSQTEPLPPEKEPPLPAELVRLFNSEVEYFFRFNPPPAIGTTLSRTHHRLNECHLARFPETCAAQVFPRAGRLRTPHPQGCARPGILQRFLGAFPRAARARAAKRGRGRRHRVVSQSGHPRPRLRERTAGAAFPAAPVSPLSRGGHLHRRFAARPRTKTRPQRICGGELRNVAARGDVRRDYLQRMHRLRRRPGRNDGGIPAVSRAGRRGRDFPFRFGHWEAHWRRLERHLVPNDSTTVTNAHGQTWDIKLLRPRTG